MDEMSNIIDNILKKKYWTDKEFSLFKLLEEKVKNYQSVAKSYLRSNTDKQDIIANLKEQPWLEKCKIKSAIVALIKKMEIREHVYEHGPDQTALKLRVNFEYFDLVIRYTRTKTTLKYFVYFERTKGDTIKAYVCYLDSTDQQKKMQLPEFDKIMAIVKTRFYRFSNYDVVHFASEFLAYYDEDNEISNVKMGINYPISLPYFASKQ